MEQNKALVISKYLRLLLKNLLLKRIKLSSLIQLHTIAKYYYSEEVSTPFLFCWLLWFIKISHFHFHLDVEHPWQNYLSGKYISLIFALRKKNSAVCLCPSNTSPLFSSLPSSVSNSLLAKYPKKIEKNELPTHGIFERRKNYSTDDVSGRTDIKYYTKL